MDKGKIFFISLVVFVALSFLLVFWLGILNTWTYLTALAIIVIVFVNGVLLDYIAKMLAGREKATAEDEDKFPACWRNMNAQLSEMPEGAGIRWDKSFGVRTKEKSFSNGTKLVRFLAVLALNSMTQQYNIIIYNIDQKNIVQFTSSPSVDQLENLFHKFEPFEKQQFMNNNLYHNKINDKRKGISLTIDQNDENYSQPSSPIVTSALNKLDGKPQQ